MNAQTAAIYDFQKPLAFKQKGIKPIKINFMGDALSPNQKQYLTHDFTHNWKEWRIRSMLAKDHNNGNADIDYQMAQKLVFYAMGKLSTLETLGLINQKENDRLYALFSEQADLFDDRQAA